jgi:hypothetical protein
VKLEIKTTNIQQVPDRDLKRFRNMFSGGSTKPNPQSTDRKSASINTFRKNEVFRPLKESGKRTVDLGSPDKDLSMGGLLHRIAEELQPVQSKPPLKKPGSHVRVPKQFAF